MRGYVVFDEDGATERTRLAKRASESAFWLIAFVPTIAERNEIHRQSGVLLFAIVTLIVVIIWRGNVVVGRVVVARRKIVVFPAAILGRLLRFIGCFEERLDSDISPVILAVFICRFFTLDAILRLRRLFSLDDRFHLRVEAPLIRRRGITAAGAQLPLLAHFRLDYLGPRQLDFAGQEVVGFGFLLYDDARLRVTFEQLFRAEKAFAGLALIGMRADLTRMALWRVIVAEDKMLLPEAFELVQRVTTDRNGLFSAFPMQKSIGEY